MTVKASDLAQVGTSPVEVLRAAKAARSEVRSQLERLQDQRHDIANSLGDEGTPAAARAGLEARLKDVDARIAATDAQLAQADAAVVKATAVPGSTVPDVPQPENHDDAYVAIPVVFTMCVLAPIAIAYARRIWKRGSTVIAPVPREVTDRLEQLGQSVESIALEVERIGEGQRFMTKVMSDNARAIGAGAAQPIPVAQTEKARA